MGYVRQNYFKWVKTAEIPIWVARKNTFYGIIKKECGGSVDTALGWGLKGLYFETSQSHCDVP